MNQPHVRLRTRAPSLAHAHAHFIRPHPKSLTAERPTWCSALITTARPPLITARPPARPLTLHPPAGPPDRPQLDPAASRDRVDSWPVPRPETAHLETTPRKASCLGVKRHDSSSFIETEAPAGGAMMAAAAPAIPRAAAAPGIAAPPAPGLAAPATPRRRRRRPRRRRGAAAAGRRAGDAAAPEQERGRGERGRNPALPPAAARRASHMPEVMGTPRGGAVFKRPELQGKRMSAEEVSEMRAVFCVVRRRRLGQDLGRRALGGDGEAGHADAARQGRVDDPRGRPGRPASVDFEEFLKVLERAKTTQKLAGFANIVHAQKATVMQVKKDNMVHSFAEEECVAFCDFVNNRLAHDPKLSYLLPIREMTDLFSVVADGVVLCKLVNEAVPRRSTSARSTSRRATRSTSPRTTTSRSRRANRSG